MRDANIERREGEDAEEVAVVRLTEDHIRTADAILIPEKRAILSTRDLAAVSESELVLAKGLIPNSSRIAEGTRL